MTDEIRIERNDIIRGLLERLDRHSPSERAHAERVAVYAVATGEAMGLDDELLLNLRYAALLHDVGKISVDARLLSKIGLMSEQEMGALRLHALIAASVLESFEWLSPCLPDIRHHHERWDGQGYPDGLTGPDIPLGARIIGVAEVFDVIVTGQHSDARTEEGAIAEIRRCAGTQFDPRVVDAFLEIQPLVQPLEAV
jgi:HD-GYP domain-containing protein (c-di-GMP phosphodiesterase class II)